MREKDQLYRVSRHLARLCASLEARLVPVTPEYLGLMQLDELRSQNAIMRRIGRNLYVTVPDTVEERIATELLDAVQPMRDGFVHAAARLARLDERLAERLIGADRDRSAGIDRGGRARRPGAVARGVAPAAGSGRSLARVRAARGQGSRPAQSRLVRALPSFVQLFELSTEGLRSLDLRLEQALARIKTALDSLPAERATPAAAGAALDRLRTSLNALAEMRRELDGLGRAFRDVAGTSRAILAAQHDQNATDDPELAAALEQLSRNVERFNERVRAFVVHADQELARSSRMLTGVAGDLEQEPR